MIYCTCPGVGCKVCTPSHTAVLGCCWLSFGEAVRSDTFAVYWGRQLLWRKFSARPVVPLNC